MATLEDTLEQACKDKVLPGGVLVASNTSGSFRYTKAFGSSSLDSNKAKPVQEDAVFWIASASKLHTSIAALQCVERNQIQLDDDVTKVLPELGKVEVLNGFDDEGKPNSSARKNTITLRRLLTHSSGVGYASFDRRIQDYRQFHGEPLMGDPTTVPGRFSGPLLFEPGTNWLYGANMDWIGKLVERLNNDITLEEYLKKNVWGAVGAKDITFWIDKRQDMLDRLIQMTNREHPDDPVKAYTGPDFNAGTTDCLGGQGLYASLPEYHKILHSLLINDEKLLKKETVLLMTQPHLENEAKTAFRDLHQNRPSIFDNFIGELNPEIDVDFGLGSLVFMQDDPGWRGKGTLHWGGLPNLFWWIDYQNDLCGIFGTQVMPPGDRPVAKLITLFEKEMYKNAVAAAKN